MEIKDEKKTQTFGRNDHLNGQIYQRWNVSFILFDMDPMMCVANHFNGLSMRTQKLCLRENIYVQCNSMVYNRIPMGTNCVPLKVDMFLYCDEGYFMCNLYKSERVDIISTCLTIPFDIFRVQSPSAILNFRSIFPTFIHQNKQTIRTQKPLSWFEH